MPQANVPLPTVPANRQLFRVNIKYIWRGNKYQTRFAYLAKVDNTTTTPQALADAAASALMNQLLDCLSADAEIYAVEADDLHDLSEPIGSATSFGLPAPGTVAQQSLPGQVAMLLTKYTNVRSKHGRGFNFLPCPPITFITAGQLNGLALTALGSLRTVLLADLVVGAVHYDLAVYQRSNEPIAPSILRASPVVKIVLGVEFTDRSTRKPGRGQ